MQLQTMKNARRHDPEIPRDISRHEVSGSDRRTLPTWTISPGETEAVLDPDAPDWFDLRENSNVTLVKRGHRRSTWRVRLNSGRTMYAKIFESAGPGILNRIGRWLRRSPAHREWRTLTALRERGIPVIRPIGLGIANGPKYRAVLLTEGVENALHGAQKWAQMRANSSPTSARKQAREVIEAVARLWAESHEKGYAHPDGHPGNILIFENRSRMDAVYLDVSPRSALSSGMPGRGTVSPRRAIRSLAQLDHFFRRSASRTDRMRFWRRYATLRGITSHGRRDEPIERVWLRRIAECEVVHAAALARHRDRRLRGDGKYFAALNLGGGWRATVALTLERRHRFAEADVADRDLDTWKHVLNAVIGRRDFNGAMSDDGAVRLVAMRRMEARKAFEHCHRLRHRDIDAPLILGWLARRGRWGMVEESYIIVPATAAARGKNAK